MSMYEAPVMACEAPVGSTVFYGQGFCDGFLPGELCLLIFKGPAVMSPYLGSSICLWSSGPL